MSSYNEDIEEEQPHTAEDSRRGYYRVAPVSDEDISTKSINDDEAVLGSNKTDPGTRAEGDDQRLRTPGTKRQTEESVTGLSTDSEIKVSLDKGLSSHRKKSATGPAERTSRWNK